MSKVFNSIAVLLSLTCLIALAQGEDPRMPSTDIKVSKEEQIVAEVSRLFVPGGFDDNDIVEVIVQGMLPSPCYSIDKGYAIPDMLTGNITVFVTATSTWSKRPCPEYLVNYVQTVKVGQLKAKHDYNVLANQGSSTVNKLFSVKKSDTDGADDFVYAPVDSVVTKKDENGTLSIVLHGKFPRLTDGCMVMKDIKTVFDAEDVLAILPKTEEKPASRCTAEELAGKYFDEKIELKSGEYPAIPFVIHVRALNGSSINKFINPSEAL